MLQACVLHIEGGWDEYLALIEFAYNNSYQSIIQMSSYEVLLDENVDHQFIGMKLEKEVSYVSTW